MQNMVQQPDQQTPQGLQPGQVVWQQPGQEAWQQQQQSQPGQNIGQQPDQHPQQGLAVGQQPGEQSQQAGAGEGMGDKAQEGHQHINQDEEQVGDMAPELSGHFGDMQQDLCDSQQSEETPNQELEDGQFIAQQEESNMAATHYDHGIYDGVYIYL